MNALTSHILIDKSFENASMQSGGKKSDKNITVNFAIGGPKVVNENTGTAGAASGNTAYGIPTLKMLNPELYKEMEKAEK